MKLLSFLVPILMLLMFGLERNAIFWLLCGDRPDLIQRTSPLGVGDIDFGGGTSHLWEFLSFHGPFLGQWLRRYGSLCISLPALKLPLRLFAVEGRLDLSTNVNAPSVDLKLPLLLVVGDPALLAVLSLKFLDVVSALTDDCP